MAAGPGSGGFHQCTCVSREDERCLAKVPLRRSWDGRRPHPHSGLLSAAQPRCRQAAQARPEHRPQQQQRSRRCFCCWWLRWWRWLFVAAPAHQHQQCPPQEADGGHQDGLPRPQGDVLGQAQHKSAKRRAHLGQGRRAGPPHGDDSGSPKQGGGGGGSSMALAKAVITPPAHCFVKRTFHKPVYCHHCTDLLWGIIGQGYTCEGTSAALIYL